MKLFPPESPHVPTPEEFRDLVAVLDSREPASGGPRAGYTYFGQFIDHDFTFIFENAGMPTIEEIVDRGPVDPATLTVGRKPALDLDSVYGGGPSDSTVRFDRATGKFILDDTDFAPKRDLPRDRNLRALIADPRNDENLLVAQVQVLFMSLHNRIVDDLRRQRKTNPDHLFAAAREEVVRVFQYLVLHDFVEALVPPKVYQKIVVEGLGQLSVPNIRNPTVALEVSDAAFRLHSLVRSSYRINDSRDRVGLDKLMELTGRRGNSRSAGRPLLKYTDEVSWRHFFKFAKYGGQAADAQSAMRISFSVVSALRNLRVEGRDAPISMQHVNMLRCIGRGLCTGQEVVERVTKLHSGLAKELELSELPLTRHAILDGLPKNNSVFTKSPLWLYLMLEAHAAGGARMGVLGGWLLADALRTAVLNADVRLHDPGNPKPVGLYEPLLEETNSRSGLTFEDVVMYTYQ